MLDVTTDDIKEGHKKVLESSNYGQEHKLIQDVLMKYPKNNDMIEIALKISLIDVTNSTNLNRYKSRICVPDLAKIICKIENFDERVRQGDITLVGELARCNGNINLFSFASKYCCYHNTLVYKKDDYSIYDTVIKD
ncbi:MAG: hypothetical protein LUG16_08610, partial [Candidatus Gastranaerophilales bacterium]|nr:hypothetical protein [Candidatus Gastranaerophilales bacterium]